MGTGVYYKQKESYHDCCNTRTFKSIFATSFLMLWMTGKIHFKYKDLL